MGVIEEEQRPKQRNTSHLDEKELAVVVPDPAGRARELPSELQYQPADKPLILHVVPKRHHPPNAGRRRVICICCLGCGGRLLAAGGRGARAGRPGRLAAAAAGYGEGVALPDVPLEMGGDGCQAVEGKLIELLVWCIGW